MNRHIITCQLTSERNGRKILVHIVDICTYFSFLVIFLRKKNIATLFDVLEWMYRNISCSNIFLFAVNYCILLIGNINGSDIWNKLYFLRCDIAMCIDYNYQLISHRVEEAKHNFIVAWISQISRFSAFLPLFMLLIVNKRPINNISVVALELCLSLRW